MDDKRGDCVIGMKTIWRVEGKGRKSTTVGKRARKRGWGSIDNRRPFRPPYKAGSWASIYFTV